VLRLLLLSQPRLLPLPLQKPLQLKLILFRRIVASS
jgi:hypothetical protein